MNDEDQEDKEREIEYERMYEEELREEDYRRRYKEHKQEERRSY